MDGKASQIPIKFDLAKSELVKYLRKENQTLLIANSTKVSLTAGQNLFFQHDPGDAIYIVKFGAIEINIMSRDGKKLSLNVMQAGDVFGEIAALDGGLRTATATAVEPSELLRLDRAKMFQLIGQHPDLAMDFFQVLCARLRWVSQQVEDMALLDIEGRLANRLLILHRKFADPEGTLHLSQSELADFLGVTRESINKILQTWRANDLITLSRGSVRVCNPDGLARVGY